MNQNSLPPGIVREPRHRHRIFVVDALQHFKFRSTDIIKMGQAKHLGELGEIALRHISRIGPFCTGIGPITTGNPLRSADQNFEIFRAVYLRIIKGGLPGPRSIFYQLLFESDIKRIADESYDKEHNADAFYEDLFKYFYGPIMNHEYLEAVWRMPDWSVSTGARIEHDLLSNRKKVPIFYDAVDHVAEVKDLLV
ncbi:MAG: hypothetical protein KBC78_04415 [Candidatus Pacebacteria bacterium]|nr:hypothetical protein [Candidatus Paceibacterota bacterium]